MGTVKKIGGFLRSSDPEDDLGFLAMVAILIPICIGLWFMIIRLVLMAWGQIL